jgi:phosphonopyruvate decarboxylase
MIRSQRVLEVFRERGVSFFTGVPDSLLKDFCAYLADHAGPDEHVIAANEGGAVALAMGQYLATGKPALVYMQNSGFGNALNPLLSLADREVYGVPMVLMVGWRGEPGRKDEPQHVKQGRIMEGLFRALEIPYLILDRETVDPEGLVAEACRTAVEQSTPFAILVRSGAFEPCRLGSRDDDEPPITREQAIRAVADSLSGRYVIVSTTGKASRELFEYRVARAEGHARDFLTVGGMGHASQIALGIALRRPDLQVHCFDGDGAVLMHMGALAVIGSQAPKNFRHIVFNNGAHDSVGGQPTVGFMVDLPAIARASGYRLAERVRTMEDIRMGMETLTGGEGPVLLEIQVRKGARSDLGRPTTTPIENRDALIEGIRMEIAR